MGMQVRFVSDQEMPEGHDFVVVQLPTGMVTFYRERAVTPRTIESAWAACRRLLEERRLSYQP